MAGDYSGIQRSFFLRSFRKVHLLSDALTPNMEMYLKTIYEIGDEGRTPRVKAIADQLGVTMPRPAAVSPGHPQTPG
jgi:hypothetical protein